MAVARLSGGDARHVAFNAMRAPIARSAVDCWMCCAATTLPSRVPQLDVAWLTDTAQRDRALDSLLVDGLVEQTADGRFALAGEGDEALR